MSDQLKIAMQAAIPLHIMHLQEIGGPTTQDIEAARATADLLGEKGDILLFGGGKKGEAADIFNKTAKAIAVLAFCPGGVTLLGSHFEVATGAQNDGTLV